MNNVVTQPIDDKQQERLVRRFGAGALHWLDGLPRLVTELMDEWGCTVEGRGPQYHLLPKEFQLCFERMDAG